MDNAFEAERAAIHRREVVTVWVFGGVLIAGMAALGIFAMLTYS